MVAYLSLHFDGIRPLFKKPNVMPTDAIRNVIFEYMQKDLSCFLENSACNCIHFKIMRKPLQFNDIFFYLSLFLSIKSNEESRKVMTVCVFE